MSSYIPFTTCYSCHLKPPHPLDCDLNFKYSNYGQFLYESSMPRGRKRKNNNLMVNYGMQFSQSSFNIDLLPAKIFQTRITTIYGPTSFTE